MSDKPSVWCGYCSISHIGGELITLPQHGQRQDSLHDQLKTLRHLANKAGCYDAADYLRAIIEDTEKRLAQIEERDAMRRNAPKALPRVNASPEQVKRYLNHLLTVSDDLFYKICQRIPSPFMEAWWDNKDVVERARFLIRKRNDNA